ncbi:cytochrome P450 [Amycolatopsis speibonae]|uniref:Cytochrome P450 n=1 Tax=Amycolatopsis speibonae TaxID=1450224 RepID=A0ABV7NYE2_9PSEU
MHTIDYSADQLLRRLFSVSGRRDPYPWLNRLREEHPVHRTESDVVVFSEYATVSAITRDPVFAVKDATWLDEHLLGWRDNAGMRLFYTSPVVHNGQNHQRLRRAMAPAFVPARHRRLTQVMSRELENRLDALGARADLHTDLTLPMTLAVICEVTGLPVEQGVRVYELIQPLLGLLDPYVSARKADSAHEAAVELEPYLSALVAGSRRTLRDDLVSRVSTLADEEAVPALFLALAAGFDTTITLLDNMIRALLAGAERPVAPDANAVVNETLRYDPPLQLITRVARADTTVAGTRLAAGQEVMALLAAAQRDPAWFTDPDTFRLDRPAIPLVAFGGGAHYCLGAQLAKLAATLMLPALSRRYPRMRVAGAPQPNNRITLRGWTTVPVVLEP